MTGTLRNLRRAAALLGLTGALAVIGVTAAVVSFPAAASATTTTLAPEALSRAALIRAETNARYRLLPGRRLVVTEATSTGVVGSLTLLTGPLDRWRIVAADNGIYFAICSSGARCPYPAKSAVWPVAASLPRRQALELALQTFVTTSVSLVVVALPAAEPVWLVFERDDLLSSVDARALLDELTRPRAVADADLIGRLTLPRLYRPLPILPPPRDTFYAAPLFLP
jgi:hypothetical protein